MRAVVLCVTALFVGPLCALTLKGSGVDGPAPVHFEPQVAVLCDSKSDVPYYSQYMSENGRWTSDTKRKVGCLKEKVDILDYCKKVYPKNDITNIVESSHYVKIGNWCKMGYNKCKHTDWVKPYRCLEGQFQSDALLVPENCIFDHVHNQSKCWPFDRWNQTAAQACQDRDHNLRSFAMLLPCGISLFSGVEFVCCPYKDKIQLKKTSPIAAADGLLTTDQFDVEEDIDDDDEDEDDDDDVNDDEEDDDDYDNYDDVPPPRILSTSSTTTTMATTTKKATTTTTTTTTVPPPPPPPSTTTESSQSHTTPSGPVRNLPTPDTYFTHFDPKEEHKLYKEALNRLEELHREKVTKVMKDWSDLEERYQEMRSKDPHMAEEFKQRMTLRFQQTVQSLEEEGSAEKHQLFAMHQQRVNAHINHRKKEAMNCYVFALNENPPNTHRVQKCLQKLLRSLHKDRHHTIAHYRHLLASSIELAEREKSVTLEHLVDIDHMVNQSLQMLYRYPTLSRKISQLMSDYIQALRSKDDTPGSLLAMTREAEASILDKYKEEISTPQDGEKSRLRYPIEIKRKQPHEMVESKEAKLQVETADEFDANENAEPQQHSVQQPQVQQPSTAIKPDQSIASVAAVQHHDHDSEPKISHAQVHDISHGEGTYFTRKNFHQDSRNVHITLAFAGLSLVAAICVGVAVIRRRNAKLPQNQGFIEVDQGISQEERHVANMQINGYENPTYKYFEVKDQ